MTAARLTVLFVQAWRDILMSSGPVPIGALGPVPDIAMPAVIETIPVIQMRPAQHHIGIQIGVPAPLDTGWRCITIVRCFDPAPAIAADLHGTGCQRH